ncbi:MAG: DNA topoisomerase IV subunit A [Candidatus Diapherotrites archaeon]|nr:DNA topoisomerase IV subunit A [Candidatus Diapherotrites archaeon]
MIDEIKKVDEEIKAKLAQWAKEIIERAKKTGELAFFVPVRTLSNVIWDEEKGILRMGERVARRDFLNIGQSKRFLQTVIVASAIKSLVEEGVTTSLRDVFYRVKFTIPGTKENVVDDQSESDRAIEDLETILGFVREEFHVFSKGGKGHVAGPIEIEEYVYSPDGKHRVVEVDGTNVGMGGWAVPPIVEPQRVKIKKVEADFVLVIEKAAVWTRFHEDRFWDEHNAIIVTAEGMPDRATRRFIHRLHYEYKLPIYVMTDADPWGWYIYSVYKQGSINLSYLSPQLATPPAKFLGMTISDYYDFNFPRTVQIKLNDRDVKRLKEMRRYPWFQKKEWLEEFNLMEKKGFKMELEAASSKHWRFISKEYVPAKLEAGKVLP